MKEAKSPAFQFYPKEWLGDDNILLMSFAARGMHIQLMCIAWQQEPRGSVPDDDDALRGWCGYPADWESLKKQILRAWELRDGRWFQRGLLKAIQKQEEWREKSRTGGLRSADSRRMVETETKREGSLPVGSAKCQPIPQPAANSSSSSSSSSSVQEYTHPSVSLSSEQKEKSAQPDSSVAWEEFVASGLRAGMIAADDELEELRQQYWDRMSIPDRLAAFRGILLRVQSGEYGDPAYVPTFAAYLAKGRWLRPLRQQPRPSGPQSATRESISAKLRQRAAEAKERERLEKLSANESPPARKPMAASMANSLGFSLIQGGSG